MCIYFTAANFVQGLRYFQVWIMWKWKINMKMESRLGGYNGWLRTLLGLNFSSFVDEIVSWATWAHFVYDVLLGSLWWVSEKSVLVALTALQHKYWHWCQFCFQVFLPLALSWCRLFPENSIHLRELSLHSSSSRDPLPSSGWIDVGKLLHIM